MYEWTNGEVITADKLNNTGNVVMLPTTPDGLDASFNDITSFLQQGVLPVMVESYDGMNVSYLYAAYPYDGKYYAEFFSLATRGSIEIGVSTLTADSPTEKMVWA